jgi:hypothetical protein
MKDKIKKKPRLKLLCKIIFCVAYSFLAAEIFLRIFAPEPMLPRYICATRYGIRGNQQNSSYWHTTPDCHINIRINSKGIRSDEEIPYSKPPGVKRIVLLGDSFGMGYEVNLEDTFSSQMIKLLQQAGIKCEVINLSVSGHGNAEELITLREEGLKYQPDLVLLAWHGSDYSDNVRSDLFGLEGDRLVRKNLTYLPGVKIREFLFRFSIYRLMADHSQFYNFIRAKVAGYVKDMLVLSRNSPETKSNTTQPSTKFVLKPDGYPKNLTIALLQEIQNECIKHNAKFFILDIPFYRGRTEFVSRFPEDAKGGTYSFDVFCPIELFRQHKGEIIYWEHSNCHFTPLGCRIVGEGLAGMIIKLHLL